LARPALTFGLEDQAWEKVRIIPSGATGGAKVVRSVVPNRRLASPDRGLNGLGN